MAVRRIITNRAKKSIRNLYWRSTRKSIQRNQETKSLVDAMVELVDVTPLSPSSESRGVLGVWKNKGYTIFESTHCFVRYSSGIRCKPMDSKQRLKRKWYFACVVDISRNTVYIVNAVYAKYIDRLNDNTPTAIKFMNAMKGVITRRNKKDAARRQLTIPFPENESKKYRLKQLINECVDKCLRKYLKENTEMLNESNSKQEKEQMLVDLYNYLSQEPTDDIYDGGTHGKSYINTTYKAYNYFEPKSIVQNVWAIHYTNLEGYEGIQKRGFRIGVTDNDALAYSQGYYNYEPPRKSGWNFALPIDNKYLGEDLGYGDCGFVIKTDGVRAYHKGDNDDEIIFKGCMVKKKYPFVYDEDYDCWILSGFGYGYTSSDLPRGAYYDEELEQVVFEDIYSLVQYVISK